ncbi:MAG TPA: FecR domain-containing protein [Puia sp.]|nr:FecR domain-containing protein [Puia sp.]
MERPDSFEIDPIAAKFIRNEPLSPEEDSILRDWLAHEQNRDELLRRLRDDKDWTNAQLDRLNSLSGARVWGKIESQLEPFWNTDTDRESSPHPAGETATTGSHRAVHRSIGWRRYVAAASVLLACAGAVFLATRHNTPPTSTAVPAVALADRPPGSDRAILTLSDGRHIDLDSSANGVLTTQGSTFVAKRDGQLAYNKAASNAPAAEAYNTLVTPRAGQFQITLSDGTRVWLNNASSLRYPVWFTGTDREVELTGEAYFDVAHDAAHPFHVHVLNSAAGKDGGTIDVLGTAFNIMAYGDENTERATLVDGSIRYVRAGHSVLLKPDEQSVVDAAGDLKTLHDVNTEEITAWKNGYFHFDHTSLEETMRQLARWYDITVEYKGTIPPQEFVGKIQRTIPLSAVLRGLESDQVHFQLQGNRLIVTP